MSLVHSIGRLLMSLVHTSVAQVVARVPFTPGHEMVGEVSHYVLFQCASVSTLHTDLAIADHLSVELKFSCIVSLSCNVLCT